MVDNRTPAHFDFIDALRGWAIIGVIGVHCSQHVTDLLPQTRTLFSGGAKGVQLFFVLSAFTLFHSWNSRPEQKGKTAMFFLRRYSRIAPMYYFGIVLYLIIYGWGARFYAPHGVSGSDIALNVAFLNAWWPGSAQAVVPGGTTIGVEFSFYLLLPILALHVRNIPRVVLAIVCSLCVALILNKIFRPSFLQFPLEAGQADNFLFNWLPTQMPIFLIGIASYMLWRRDIIQNSTLAMITTIIVTTGILILPFIPVGKFRYLIYGALFGILILSLAKRHSAILVNAVSRHFGKISFSAYILHWSVIDAIEKFDLLRLAPESIPPEIVFIIYYFSVCAIVAIVSTLTFHCIEKPFMDLPSRLSSRLSRATDSPGRPKEVRDEV